jgi:hypothetical protein
MTKKTENHRGKKSMDTLLTASYKHTRFCGARSGGGCVGRGFGKRQL